ncbi:MAG: alanine dehydrogenase [Gammaproteobacteria bacterium]|nr:alanine dehydrogenase [Gammaproteobacteria bacterium]
MLIGIPKEIKNNEFRVGLTPGSVGELIHHGHQVIIETNAGLGIGHSDLDYQQAGASIAGSAAEVFAQADMIVKVKEPQAVERAMLRPGQVLFTYLHLAPDPAQTNELIESDAICIAYETVTSARGGLPLLTPMSQVAGRMSIQAGAHCLEQSQGGKGLLLGGVPGVAAAKVVVLGGGVVGHHAAAMAVGLEAEVFVLDRDTEVLKYLWRQFGASIQTIYSTRETVEEHVLSADLVVGSVLIPGAATPKLVTADMVAAMEPGSVLVDVAIDQGGCFETSRPTTHAEPTYIQDNVIHYCVANMPGAVPKTSTYALNNATLPYVLALANKGYLQALTDDPHLRNGLNVYRGKLTLDQVAQIQGLAYTSADQALGL